MKSLKQWACVFTATSGRISNNYYIQALSAGAAEAYAAHHLAQKWLLPDEELRKVTVTETSDDVVMKALGPRIAPPLFPL